MLISAFDTNSIAGIIIDLVFVLILIVSLAAGAKKGLVKMSMGLVSSILVIAIAIFAASPVTELVAERTTWSRSIAEKLEQPIGKQLPEPYLVIFYHDHDENENTPDELVFRDEEGQIHLYDDIFNSSLLGTFKLHKILRPAIEKSLETEESAYLVKAVTHSLATLILLVATFVALLIVSKIILSILFYLLKKAVSSLYIIHFFDKVVGALLGVALGVVVILCLLTVLQLLQTFTFMDPINLAIEKSYLTKYAVEYNFIYKFLVARVGFASLLGRVKAM